VAPQLHEHPRAERGRTRKTKRTMAEYFQDNFVVTNSGVEDPLAVRYSIDKLGIDNVMWAIDYPYQPMEPAVASSKSSSAPTKSATHCAMATPNAFFISIRRNGGTLVSLRSVLASIPQRKDRER
jgi:hypothetical protein